MSAYRVRINHKTALATLSGVPYPVLRQLITAACLHHYDELAKPDRDGQHSYSEQRLKACRLIEEAFQTAMGFPPPPGNSKEERLARVKHSEAMRTLRKKLTAAMLDKRRSSR
jgi:hypothetical protein